ncbi:MAG TPA: pitrilysin family protein [Chitinivibrionales bacterium]|nr:pitrilysin family protein [Chitinivibrionales bacterium]
MTTYKFPPIVQETLDNGLELLCVEDHAQEGITLALQMPFGEFSDPVLREGTTEAAIGMMLKGPASLSPEEFSQELEQAGASLFTDAGDEHCVFGCKMLARAADRIIPLFQSMICSPGFLPKELTRIKREMVTGLKAELADPASIANRHFGGVLCGTGHPVGRVQTVRSVGRLGIRRVREWYNSFVSPQSGLLVVAGDFSADAMLSTLKGLFGPWKKGRSNEPVVAGPIPALAANRIRLVDKKDLTQVSLILGHSSVSELDPLRNEVALANYVLGGGNFSSRLMAHIRSREGKTYGISSQLSCSRRYGIFSIATSTQNSQAKEMLASIIDVYRTFGDKGVTQEELNKAKQFVMGNMAFQLEGIVNVAEKILWLKQFGRDLSYIEQFNDRIASITLESVNRAIGEHLSSKAFAVVGVGRKEEIGSVLAELGTVETVNFRSL